MNADYRCLIYCPMPYAGQGWPETCINVVSNFPEVGIQPILVVPRARKAVPTSILVKGALPFPLSNLPWRHVGRYSKFFLEMKFRELIDRADSRRTIAYFWPGTDPALVNYAKRAGVLCVREMINTCQSMAKEILDRAYDLWGYPRAHCITPAAIRGELNELQIYDYVFAPNAEVERSLVECDIRRERIIPTSYGWLPERFDAPRGSARRGGVSFTAIFVGYICVRKGIPELLAAWEQSEVNGELVLVGDIEPVLQSRVTSAVQGGRVRHMPYTDDIGSHYRNADVFVFPSLEEGGPQVTIEAGGCGLPAIVTPMGAGRLVEHDVNGFIVRAGDINDLISSIRRMAFEPELRARFAQQISKDARKFAYQQVSEARGATLASLMRKRPSDR